MKKILLTLALALALLLMLTACGAPAAPAPASEPPETEDVLPEDNESDAAAEPEVPEEPALEPDAPSVPYNITREDIVIFKQGLSFAWYQIIIEVENTGTEPLFLSHATFEIRDEEDNLVCEDVTDALPYIIAPGEKGYFLASDSLNPVDAVFDARLSYTPVIEAAVIEDVRYNVVETAFGTDPTYGGITVTGSVEKTADVPGHDAYVFTLLYDAEDALLGCIGCGLTRDFEESAAVGAAEEFEIRSTYLPENVTLDTIARHETIALPLRSNFVPKH